MLLVLLRFNGNGSDSTVLNSGRSAAINSVSECLTVCVPVCLVNGAPLAAGTATACIMYSSVDWSVNVDLRSGGVVAVNADAANEL